MSTRACRLRPLIFLPASYPRGPPASVVLTLWVSMTAAVGPASRPTRSTIARHQLMVQALPCSVITKAGEPAIRRLVRWEMLRQHAPGTAAAQHVEDGIDDFAHRPGPFSAGPCGRRQQRREHLPFGIGQIAGVAQVVPVVLCPGLAGPHRQFQGQGEPLHSPASAVFKPSWKSFETASQLDFPHFGPFAPAVSARPRKCPLKR